MLDFIAAFYFTWSVLSTNIMNKRFTSEGRQKHKEHSSDQFHFKCNSHIAIFIQENARVSNDLNSAVGHVAKVLSIYVNNSGVGIVKLQKKQVRRFFFWVRPTHLLEDFSVKSFASNLHLENLFSLHQIWQYCSIQKDSSDIRDRLCVHCQ